MALTQDLKNRLVNALVYGNKDTFEDPVSLKVFIGKFSIDPNAPEKPLQTRLKVAVVDKKDVELSILFDQVVDEGSTLTLDEVSRAFSINVNIG